MVTYQISPKDKNHCLAGRYYQLKHEYLGHGHGYQVNHCFCYCIPIHILCIFHSLLQIDWASFSEKMLRHKCPAVPCLSMTAASATGKVNFPPPLLE